MKYKTYKTILKIFEYQMDEIEDLLIPALEIYAAVRYYPIDDFVKAFYEEKEKIQIYSSNPNEFYNQYQNRLKLALFNAMGRFQ